MANEIEELTRAVTELEEALEQGPEPILDDDLAIPDEPSSDYLAPWDRQPEETKDSYWVLFKHYRDSGLGRSVKETHEWYNETGGTPEQPTISLQAVYRISSRFRWAERAPKWDTEQDRLYQIARAQATRDMIARHQAQVETALDGLMAPIAALNRRMAQDEHFIEGLSQTNAKKLITLANSSARIMPSLMAAERLAHDMPTQLVSGSVDVNHNLRVDRDHIGEVLEVLDRAGVLNVGGNHLGTGEIVDAEVVDVYPVPAEGDE